MIRFKILGKGYLELPSDFQFSFNYNNGVFAFENMQLSRSGEFTIPETPNNNNMLDFANNQSNDGSFVRNKKKSELYFSGGKIDGWLYISKYSNGYSAIFVYGELSALKRISELGNISSFAKFIDFVVPGTTPIKTSYQANGNFPYAGFDFYNYKNGVDDANKNTDYFNLSPTVRLSHLVSGALAYLDGLTIDYTTIANGVDSIGIILSQNNAAKTLVNVTVSGIPNSTLNFSGGSAFFDLVTKKFHYTTRGAFWKVGHSQMVRCLQAKTDVTVRFNTNSGTVGCVGGNGYLFYSPSILNPADFFGTVRDGMEINFKKGDYFTFVNRDDYMFAEPVSKYVGSVSISFDVYVGSSGEVDLLENYYLRDNLPDVTFIDLLKIYANIFKCGILYDVEANRISFFNFIFDLSTAMQLDDVCLEIKSVDRTFLNYAKRNYIKYKNEDYVENSLAEIVYKINNDNIEDEKILYSIPFSEGIKDLTNNVVLQDFDKANEYKRIAKKDSIAIASMENGNIYMKHISEIYNHFPTILNSKLKDIIENSTTVVMTVKMNDKTFLNIKNTDSFKYRGKYYCCITGTHAGSTSELTLIRI